MDNKNFVYIGQSMDGYISDKNDGLDWLNMIPNPEQDDMGYSKFMKSIDAMIMGRKTFEIILNFDGDWPYEIPVFVLSNTLPNELDTYPNQVSIVKGTLTEVLTQVHQLGYHQLYIDGGLTIQKFLQEDLIDELILTTIPVILGGGTSLFSELPTALKFELVKSTTYLNTIVQNHYKRV